MQFHRQQIGTNTSYAPDMTSNVDNIRDPPDLTPWNDGHHKTWP